MTQNLRASPTRYIPKWQLLLAIFGDLGIGSLLTQIVMPLKKV